MIDAEIAGDTGADRKLALDGAARRHHEILGEQDATDLLVAVDPARPAKQRAIFLGDAELLRCHEAAFPQPLAIFPGAGLVRLEAACRRGFDIQRKTLADQQLTEARGLALDLADAEMPLLVRGVD